MHAITRNVIYVQVDQVTEVCYCVSRASPSFGRPWPPTVMDWWTHSTRRWCRKWASIASTGYSTIRWSRSNDSRDAYRCLHLECWTASRWPMLLRQMMRQGRRRRLRCIQTHSDGICQPLNPARMMNIPPRSTVQCLFWPKNTSCLLHSTSKDAEKSRDAPRYLARLLALNAGRDNTLYMPPLCSEVAEGYSSTKPFPVIISLRRPTRLGVLAVASLRLVSAGAATDGVKLFFSWKN